MREGAPVRLQPQPARVLALLVARAGEVVTRDALRQEVWNDGTFVDFERGLNTRTSRYPRPTARQSSASTRMVRA